MNSALMNQIGLGNLDVAYIFIGLIVLILILFILSIISIVKYTQLKKKYERFMRGKNAKSLEREIRDVFSDIDFLKKETESNNKEIKHIYKRLKTTYQKLGIVKYDAFNQMGGKLSFTLSLLDENNDGFVLNSVHSSDSSYCYTKVITDGECEIDLSDEEEKAIAIAMRLD